MKISVSRIGHALAGAEIEGHALPPPIVDMGLQRDEGLGLAVVADLLDVAGDRLTIDRAARVLADDASCASTSAAVIGRSARSTFTFSSRTAVALKSRRRLHRHQREQLEHVVLDHVAQRARARRNSRRGPRARPSRRP